MKIIEDTTQYKDLNFKKDTILDLCNLCSVSYNTNKVLKKNNNVKSSYIDFSKLSKGKTTNSELFDVLFILEYDIILKQKNNRNNELSLFQKRLLVSHVLWTQFLSSETTNRGGY